MDFRLTEILFSLTGGYQTRQKQEKYRGEPSKNNCNLMTRAYIFKIFIANCKTEMQAHSAYYSRQLLTEEILSDSWNYINESLIISFSRNNESCIITSWCYNFSVSYEHIQGCSFMLRRRCYLFEAQTVTVLIS